MSPGSNDTSIFMASATDSTPSPQAEPESRTHQEVKNYISKATSNLHKVWLADSRLGLLHFRFLENVNKVDRLTRKVTKLECKGASQEVILQQYLKLKTVTDRYVEKKHAHVNEFVRSCPTKQYSDFNFEVYSTAPQCTNNTLPRK